MYNIAICDDDKAICAEFESIFSSYLSKKTVSLEIYYSGEELINQIYEGAHFDLIYLDIELHAMNGVEVGKIIRDEIKNDNVQLVYISAKQQYAMELFDTRPLNFLVKPLKKTRIIETLHKAMQLEMKLNKTFPVKNGMETIRVPYGEIIFFESDNRKLIIKTVNKEYTMYGKLNDIEVNVPDFFVRIHQSYLINSLYIKRWKPTEVQMIEEERVFPVSLSYRKNVSDFLLKEEE